MSALQRLISALSPAATSPNAPGMGVQALGDGATFMDLSDPALQEFLLRGHISSSGMVVNRHTALRNATFFRALSLICSSVGMLPCHLLKETEAATDDKPASVAKAKDHPLFAVLHRKPNAWQTPFEFKSQLQFDLLAHGSAFAYQRRNARNQVEALIPLQASRVTMQLTPNLDDVVFFYDHPQKGRRPLSRLDLFWIRAPVTTDGINGLSLIEVAAEALGLASAAEKAQGSIFKNGSIVGGVLEHPKTLTASAVERLRAQFEERHTGAENAGKWVVAEEGLKVATGPQTTGREAQTVEARKLQVEEIGRITGVPRPLLMVDETSWGSGIEQLGIFFVTYCLMPWFVAWEEAITRSLLTDAEQGTYFAKFNEGALLRGSLKDQALFFSKALGSGGSPAWMSQNEVRDKFNMAPKEGGDDMKGGAGAPEGGGSDEGIDEGDGGDDPAAARPGGPRQG